MLAAAELALRLADAEAARARGQPGEDRRRRAEQRRPRPCGAARQYAAARRPTDQARAQAALDEAIAAVAAKHDVRIHVHGGFGRPPKPIDAQRAEAVRAGQAQRRRSRPGRSAGATRGGVCDGNNIAACGVPVVDTMGVRGGAIHSAQEYLIVESLVERAQLSALTILRLASGEAL